jgi:hypothetical protein
MLQVHCRGDPAGDAASARDGSSATNTVIIFICLMPREGYRADYLHSFFCVCCISMTLYGTKGSVSYSEAGQREVDVRSACECSRRLAHALL